MALPNLVLPLLPETDPKPDAAQSPHLHPFPALRIEGTKGQKLWVEIRIIYWEQQ